jgi:hypothetical protein
LAAHEATSRKHAPLVQRALRPRQRGFQRRELLGLVGTTFQIDPATRQDAKRRRSKYLQTRKVPTAETRSATTDLPIPDKKRRRRSRYVTASVTRRNLSKRHAPGDTFIRWNGVATLATIMPVTMPCYIDRLLHNQVTEAIRSNGVARLAREFLSPCIRGSGYGNRPCNTVIVRPRAHAAAALCRVRAIHSVSPSAAMYPAVTFSNTWGSAAHFRHSRYLRSLRLFEGRVARYATTDARAREWKRPMEGQRHGSAGRTRGSFAT